MCKQEIKSQWVLTVMSERTGRVILEDSPLGFDLKVAKRDAKKLINKYVIEFNDPTVFGTIMMNRAFRVFAK